MTKSDTPRVDADEEWAWSGTGEDFRCVHASFARELECELIAVTQRLVESEERERLALRNNEALRRELAAKEAELTEANRKLDRYTRRSESGESLGDALDLVEELAESRAQVARLRDVASGILNDTVLERQDAEYYKRIMAVWFGWLRTAITSLPDQSARDAEVLKAAEKSVKAFDNMNSVMDADHFDSAAFSKAAEKSQKTYRELCRAVRGDK